MDDRRRLLFHGMALFLIGLLTGLLERHFSNVRMALAAHLEGVMNGHVPARGRRDLERGQAVAARERRSLLGGNWAVTTLAAVLGTGALSPVTAAGRGAAPWQETMVTAGFVSIGLAIIAASILPLWGLRGKAALAGDAR